MKQYEKMTVPNPPAPTDGEQSSLKRSEESITQFDEDCNNVFSDEAKSPLPSSYLPAYPRPQETRRRVFPGRHRETGFSMAGRNPV